MMIDKSDVRFFAISTLVAMLVCLPMFFAIDAYADTVVPYGSVDDSNSVVNLLTDVMRSDTQYDPYNEYLIVRTGEREYSLYFGKKLSEGAVRYVYVQQYAQQPSSLTRSVVNSVSLTSNGYVCVGTSQGQARSSLAEDYKTKSVLIVASVTVLVVVLFGRFRKSEGVKSTFYKV